jgi:CDP-diacylglycerol--glycerol-3-phosphate 3-phosphatidyltransferase
VNWPNTITMARLVCTGATFLCLESIADRHHPEGTLSWTAFTLFMVAAITDFLDGYLARRLGQVSAFGRVFDPFADKVLIAGTFVILLKFPAASSVMPHWYVVIVIAREFLVTAVRGLVEASGRAFPADRLGKWKMVSQCWTAGGLLTMVAGTQIFRELTIGGLWVSLALTLVSGVNYLVKARDVLFRGL